jgi:hypothetical protein
MVAVLLMVGQHLEPPSIVSELLDVAKHPCKPTYMMAPEVSQDQELPKQPTLSSRHCRQ